MADRRWCEDYEDMNDPKECHDIACPIRSRQAPDDMREILAQQLERVKEQKP